MSQSNASINDQWTVENVAQLRQDIGELKMMAKVLGVAAQRDQEQLMRLSDEMNRRYYELLKRIQELEEPKLFE